MLVNAARVGDLMEVLRLIPICNPKAHASGALRWAAKEGHIECLRALIPVSNPKAEDYEALRLAIEFNHVECVKMLVPVCDLTFNQSEALVMAVIYQRPECVDLLYSGSDVPQALLHLQTKYPNAGNEWGFLEERLAHTQRAILEQVVNPIAPSSPTRKM